MTMEHEWEREARELGSAAAGRIDPDTVADRVRSRLARGEQLPRRRVHLSRWGLAVAAGLTIVVATDAFRGGAVEPAAAPVALSGLDDDGLVEALDSLVYTAPASEFVGWGIGTMNADELERLLAAMEG